MSAPRLLLVFHAQTPHGRTAQLAAAIEAGARAAEPQVDFRRVAALAGSVEDLLWAQAVVFCTTENFGYMSGALKHFFDTTYYPAQGHVMGLPYAIVISAGNDGSGAVSAIQRIARGYPLKEVQPALVVRTSDDLALALQRAKELGGALAAGVTLGLY